MTIKAGVRPLGANFNGDVFILMFILHLIFIINVMVTVIVIGFYRRQQQYHAAPALASSADFKRANIFRVTYF